MADYFDIETFLSSADQYINEAKLEEALDYYYRALQLSPNDRDIWEALYQGARNYISDVPDPRRPPIFMAKVPAKKLISFLTGLRAYLQQDYSESIKGFSECMLPFEPLYEGVYAYLCSARKHLKVQALYETKLRSGKVELTMPSSSAVAVSDKKKTGKRAEELVYLHYLRHCRNNVTVTWLNGDKESGLPFDIRLTLPDKSSHYIEVKGTKKPEKSEFEVTARELKWAFTEPGKYSIATVHFLNEREAKISIFEDLKTLFWGKQMSASQPNDGTLQLRVQVISQPHNSFEVDL